MSEQNHRKRKHADGEKTTSSRRVEACLSTCVVDEALHPSIVEALATQGYHGISTRTQLDVLGSVPELNLCDCTGLTDVAPLGGVTELTLAGLHRYRGVGRGATATAPSALGDAHAIRQPYATYGTLQSAGALIAPA